MSGFEINDYEACDAQAVYGIECACFTDRWSLSDFEVVPTLDYAHFFKAVRAESIVGFAGVYCFDFAELMNIAVLPEHRGMGIGKALLERCVCCAAENGCSEIFLEVRRSNIPALDLYRSFGFEFVSVRKNYYKKPTEDAQILRKDIGKI